MQNEYFAETVLLIRNKKQNVKLILILDIACPKSNSFLYIVLNENKLKRISLTLVFPNSLTYKLKQ